MKRSRYLDEQIDRLAAGGGLSSERPLADFVSRLRAAASAAPASKTVTVEQLSTAAASLPAGNVAHRSAHPITGRWRRRAPASVFISSLLGKLVIAGVALAATTGGLAVTGNLPEAAQQWVSDGASRIGVEIPAPDNFGVPGGAPVLPDDASDTSEVVVGTVFDGDPYEGEDYGEDVADTASDDSPASDNGRVADDYTDKAEQRGG